jgi:thymidylate synthase ThyX
LAASGARYSRNNDGLEAILSKIDPANIDRSVDSIFKMIDYGHQSIADMAPIAMFIDEVSVWLAYVIWSQCPTAGGQESSTRYIKLSADALIEPRVLGIPVSDQPKWRGLMAAAFEAYARALATWESIFDADPAVARIPSALLADSSEKARKQVARMRRNYGFDRARYFLPVAASTNLMLVMSARGWVQLVQFLLSHALPEPRECGEQIKRELGLAVPRLLRHATEKASMREGQARQFALLRVLAADSVSPLRDFAAIETDAEPLAFLDVDAPAGITQESLAGDLSFHDNRYAWMGDDLRRTSVRFGWNAVAMAEIRDLNRHRTGAKYCPMNPVGFYCAKDELPRNSDSDPLSALARVGKEMSAEAARLLRDGRPEYIYWTLLGTQYPFEHTTTADKFLYEAELRTGVGSHYRYARHLHDVLALWYERFPATKPFVLEGSAEPE